MSKRTDAVPTQVTGPHLLGNLIGGSSYFGACAVCRSQFVSTRDVVYLRNHERLCVRCGGKR